MEMVVVNAMFLATVFPKTEVTMYERMLKCWMNGNQFVSDVSGLITSMWQFKGSMETCRASHCSKSSLWNSGWVCGLENITRASSLEGYVKATGFWYLEEDLVAKN